MTVNSVCVFNSSMHWLLAWKHSGEKFLIASFANIEVKPARSRFGRTENKKKKFLTHSRSETAYILLTSNWYWKCFFFCSFCLIIACTKRETASIHNVIWTTINKGQRAGFQLDRNLRNLKKVMRVNLNCQEPIKSQFFFD